MKTSITILAGGAFITMLLAFGGLGLSKRLITIVVDVGVCECVADSLGSGSRPVGTIGCVSGTLVGEPTAYTNGECNDGTICFVTSTNCFVGGRDFKITYDDNPAQGSVCCSNPNQVEVFLDGNLKATLGPGQSKTVTFPAKNLPCSSELSNVDSSLLLVKCKGGGQEMYRLRRTYDCTACLDDTAPPG